MIHLINITHAAGVIEDAPTIPYLLMNILNFLLQIFGLVAIIALVISGIFYLTAGGDEDRIKSAKKSVLYSIVGIVVALMGMIIIRTISEFLK
jgi:hypothetical protein